MPAHESIAMDAKVVYNKGGRKNGFFPDDFDRPPDWENEYSDEDEVFVESPNTERSSATKPLMYPRTRTKSKLNRGPRCRCRPIVHAVCCFLFLVLSLGSLMGLVVYYVNKHNKHNAELLKQAGKSNYQFLKHKQEVDYSDIVGCDQVSVEDVWVVGLPKLLSESAFRLVDVNQDGVMDVIFGFATGADGYSKPSIVCDIYFDGAYPCFGGVMALEGATGKELWRHYADHEMYGINCAADLNKDGIPDCLAGGRAGAFQAVSGKDGSLIWSFERQEAKNEIMNLYTAQIIHDIDLDGTVDVLAIHGGDPLQDPGSAHRLSGRIILLSGRTGKVLRWMGVPDQREAYYSAQVYTWLDGTRMVLFGTGGETHGGSLWAVKLDDLVTGDINRARAIFTDEYKGVMTPPVLADVTGDGVEDIVIPVFNSSVLAIDGATFAVIWNHTFPASESYSTPSPGYYDNDDTLDFLVKYAHGPGFPVYYHSETTILDGKTGRALIDPPARDTVGAQASGVTVSMEGRGNDVFLYWAADCSGHTGEGGEFSFVQGTNVHEQSRSDFCRLRFKTKGYSKIYAVSQHIPSPGATVYFSEDRTAEEHDSWINTTQEGIDFVKTNPEYIDQYRKFFMYERQAQEEENALPQLYPKEEGSESLYETPVLNQAERTSYKKGPPKDLARDRLSDRIKPGGFSDYDYDSSPYYTDTFGGYPKSALSRSRGKGRYQSVPSYKDAGYYPTTPTYKYSRTRYRDRYPSPGRVNRDEDKQTGPDVNQHTETESDKVKPIAMREKRDALFKTQKNSNLNTNTLKLKRKHNTGSGNIKHEKKRKRKRRHVGPHDEEGLQRLLSTGTLAPTTLSTDHPQFNNSIDFVFATYWFFPAKTRAILPADRECIKNKMAAETQRFDPNSAYYPMDHDAYEHTVTDECLALSGHGLPDEGTYESQTQYNPFNVHMGQMTVYRIRLTCTCSNASLPANSTKRCGKVLPFEAQQWIGYMGNNADSHWIPRRQGL